MMRIAVQRGTGTAAQIYGYSIGGKTGTGETGIPGSNTTWFIAFAGKDEESPPELAIAVVLQNQSGPGGHDRRADRPRRHAGNPAGDGESLTSRHSLQRP